MKPASPSRLRLDYYIFKRAWAYHVYYLMDCTSINQICDINNTSPNPPFSDSAFSSRVAFNVVIKMLSLWAGAIFLCGCIFIGGLLSPLSTIPGPWYTRFTSLWLKFQELTANRREAIHHLHKTYGPVVRLGPNEVSFTSLEAIKEIYASGGGGYDKTEYYDLFRQFKIK